MKHSDIPGKLFDTRPTTVWGEPITRSLEVISSDDVTRFEQDHNQDCGFRLTLTVCLEHRSVKECVKERFRVVAHRL